MGLNRLSRLASALLPAALLSLSCTQPAADPVTRPFSLTDGEWLDLSYAFSSETIYWPTAESFEIDTVSFGETPAGFFYAANNFKAAEHGGTHLDAPIHFSAGKQSVDEIPIQNLSGPIIRIDVSSRALQDRDYLVSVGDFNAWEQANGPIPAGTMVLLHTGYGQFWPDAEAYMGTSARGPDALPDLHFPGLHPDAASWLVQSRPIKGIGIDTPSIDYGQSTLFESHRHLAGANILIFENIADLDRVPTTGAWLVAAPMKIKGGSGGPARLLAFVPSP
ncbi:MAG TPA: cyclase family protein [Rhodothermales bacterium]